MNKNAVVLGCGMVGAAMVRDLADDSAISVTACDFSPRSLERLPQDGAITKRRVDLRDAAAMRGAISDADVVLGALPSVMGLTALRAVVEAGKPYCDISFMPEDAGQVSETARTRGVTAVVDCGVAPGLSNLLAGYISAQVDEIESLRMYVGGLPRVRRWPYEYKAPFAPSDVVEEYTRPARFIESGHIVTRPALTDIELLDFAQAGTLEAFNTDGLRSLLHTVPARHMVEKTLRYPGHARLMAALRETGFFGREAIDVKGQSVRPIDLTEALLFRLWKLEEGEREFTVLRVEAEGSKDGRPMRFRYDLYDETDAERGLSSMARTTAFPCAIVARLLLSGEFAEPGVHPPEVLGRRPGMLERITGELARRGVHLMRTE